MEGTLRTRSLLLDAYHRDIPIRSSPDSGDYFDAGELEELRSDLMDGLLQIAGLTPIDVQLRLREDLANPEEAPLSSFIVRQRPEDVHSNVRPIDEIERSFELDFRNTSLPLGATVQLVRGQFIIESTEGVEIKRINIYIVVHAESNRVVLV